MEAIEAAASLTANPTRYVRYHTDAEYAQAIGKASWQCKKAALATSEELHEKRRAYNREYWKARYHADPAFRAANIAAKRAGRMKRAEEVALGDKEGAAKNTDDVVEA